MYTFYLLLKLFIKTDQWKNSCIQDARYVRNLVGPKPYKAHPD